MKIITLFIFMHLTVDNYVTRMYERLIRCFVNFYVCLPFLLLIQKPKCKISQTIFIRLNHIVYIILWSESTQDTNYMLETYHIILHCNFCYDYRYENGAQMHPAHVRWVFRNCRQRLSTAKHNTNRARATLWFEFFGQIRVCITVIYRILINLTKLLN